MRTAKKQSDEPLPLKELTPSTVTVDDLRRFPNMSAWFSPHLLLKLTWKLIVSDLFGQYADRRLIVAALDTSDKQLQIKRADLTNCINADSEGAVWVDYVADLGDGFDATYTIAFLLAQPRLRIGQRELPRGGLLVFGGDEAYPHSGRDEYIIKVRQPYSFALPDLKEGPHAPLVAVPGNHDWYDGLVTFLSVFCREKPTPIGNWRTVQRRSYFATKLTEDWWIWGIDIALVYDMDQPQANYFVNIASAMAPGSKIVLCCAKPGWYRAESEDESYRTLGYAVRIIANANKGLRIPLVLSGDAHHYARYAGNGREPQFITSGGGGAYLTGTSGLKPKLTLLKWPDEPQLEFKKCYPTEQESQELLKGNFLFFPANVGFSYLLATTYTMFAFLLTYAPRVDLTIAIYVFFFVAFLGHLREQEVSHTGKLAAVAAFHAIPHTAVVMLLAWVSLTLDGLLSTSIRQLHWFAWLMFLAFWLPFGACLGGLIYGLYLWLTARFFDLNYDDAFSAMRLDSRRHFIRMRILKDSITVYPIKIDEIPHRDRWRANVERDPNTNPSVFVPDPPLEPSLIEGPIVIRVGV